MFIANSLKFPTVFICILQLQIVHEVHFIYTYIILVLFYVGSNINTFVNVTQEITIV